MKQLVLREKDIFPTESMGPLDQVPGEFKNH